MQLINCFLNAKYNLHFASSAQTGERSANLDSLGVTSHQIKLNDNAFDDFVQELQPEVVVYDRFMVEEQYGWRVAKQCPGCIRILDTEDLHGLRKGRIQAQKEGETFTNAFLHNDTMKRELASMYRCDLSLIISEFEMQLLQDSMQVPGNLLGYLPFMVEEITTSTQENWKSFEEKKDFMTIGNFKHWPNYDALLYLKNEIWPLIRKDLPEAKLHVYGSYSSQKIEQLHKPSEGFIIEGFVSNAQEASQDARVNLAALRVGAGLKGKILESMQNGTPCVTTPIGAEGMTEVFNLNGEIANDKERFAQAAVTLYTNKDSWYKARKVGVSIVNNRFLKKTWEPVLIKQLHQLKDNLQNHRAGNFTGAMLWHQSLQASYFMSKWIMLKNKDV